MYISQRTLDHLRRHGASQPQGCWVTAVIDAVTGCVLTLRRRRPSCTTTLSPESTRAYTGRRTQWSCADLVQAALISYYYPVTWIYPALILAGGLTTLITKRKEARYFWSHPCLLREKGCRTMSGDQP